MKTMEERLELAKLDNEVQYFEEYMDEGDDEEETQPVTDAVTDIEDEEEEKTDEEKETLKEELKKLQSDTSKGVQKLVEENKILREAHLELPQCASDPEYVLTLNKTKPKVVKLILDTYYWGMTVQEFSRDVLKKDTDTTKKEVKEMDIEAILDEREAKKDLERFIKDNKLTDSEETAFREEFNALQEGKRMTPAVTAKLAKLALISISEDKETTKKIEEKKETAKWIAAWAWSSGGSNKKVSSTFGKDILSLLD